jgi:ADP-ribose pyrophosphatase YjhB (NUDIX family)
MDGSASSEDVFASIRRAPVVAGVLLVNDGRYLLLEHNSPPDARGKWGFPAGFVGVGESLEVAAVREAKEETALDVEIVRELAVYHAHADDVVKHLYLGRVTGGDVCVDDAEIAQARWLGEDEIKELDALGLLRAEWVLDGIDRFKSLPVESWQGAAVLITNEEGHVLLIHENYGLRRWGLPGGAVEYGETVRQTAIREAREEICCEVELGEVIGQYRRELSGTGVTVFTATIASGDPAVPPTGEIADVRWADPNDLPTPTTFVMPHAVADAVAGRRDVERLI